MNIFEEKFRFRKKRNLGSEYTRASLECLKFVIQTRVYAALVVSEVRVSNGWAVNQKT